MTLGCHRTDERIEGGGAGRVVNLNRVDERLQRVILKAAISLRLTQEAKLAASVALSHPWFSAANGPARWRTS